MIFNFKTFLIAIFLILCCSASYTRAQNDTSQSIINLDLYPKKYIDTNNFNIFSKQYNRKKVALVLSGGGARGFSQIGVLKSLEKNDIHFDMVVGTSIGAIIGGLYSAGYTSKELDSISKSINWESKLKLSNKNEREFLYLEQKKEQDKGLISISLDGLKPVFPTSLSTGHQVAETFNVLLLNARYKPYKDFSSLKYPFYAVATDFDNGAKVVMDKGSLSESIKASFTFPLLYAPTIVNGRNLVDGGLSANIPVDVAKEKGADIVIAVNSTSPLKSTEDLKDPLNTADQVLSITMAQLNQRQLVNADIIITPDIGNYSGGNFSDIEFLVKLGEIETDRNIRLIRRIIDSAEQSASTNKGNFITNPQVFINTDLIPEGLKKDIIREQENTFVKYTTIEEQLRKFYDLGYFRDVYAVVKRNETGLTLNYNFIENPKLADIKLNSYDNILYETIKDYQYYNNNKVLNYKDLEKLYFDLLTILKNNNLSAVDIKKFHFNYDNNTLDIEVTDGLINKINLIGNAKTNNNVIMGELTIDEKKVINKNDIDQSLQNIYSTNLFQQLSFDFDNSENSERPNLNINIIEKSTRNLKFALRGDNERKLQLYFELNNEGIFGTNNEASLSLSGGIKNREYRAELTSARFFNTYLTYNFSMYYLFNDILNYLQKFDVKSYDRTILGEYRDTRYGMSFLLGTQVGRIGTVYSQIAYEKLSRDVLSGIILDETDFKVLKFKIGGKIDTQDKYPFPTNGTIINYYYETSQKLVSANISYSKLMFDFEHSISFGNANTVKPKFVFGFADKTTPLMEQFSLGGENSFFGMLEYELRGRQVLSTSLEYRYLIPYRLFFDTYVAARYDLGQIWENAEDIRFKDLRHGVGLSAMFDTPIGKASFSAGRSFKIGNGINNNTFVFGPYTFYFSIGYDL